MCDPTSLAIAGLLTSAGGTFMETQEANANEKRAMNAKNNAYAAGMARQRQYADEAGQAFGQNLQQQGSEAFGQQQDKEITRMKDAFSRVQTDDPNYAAVPSSTPKNVISAVQNANTEADQKTNRDLNNMASLNSYTGSSFNQGLDRNNFARLFGNLQNKAGYDSNVLMPLEMSAAANNARKKASLFPQLMKYGGMAMSLGGTMGADPSKLFSFTPSSANNFGSATGPGLGGLY